MAFYLRFRQFGPGSHVCELQLQVPPHWHAASALLLSCVAYPSFAPCCPCSCPALTLPSFLAAAAGLYSHQERSRPPPLRRLAQCYGHLARRSKSPLLNRAMRFGEESEDCRKDAWCQDQPPVILPVALRIGSSLETLTRGPTCCGPRTGRPGPGGQLSGPGAHATQRCG